MTGRAYARPRTMTRPTQRSKPTTIATALALAAATALAGRPARAQSADDKAAAEALFDEGKKLFLDKKYADACPRFESSQRLDPGIGTLLYLADCYEHTGKLASAWATFREAAAAAKAAGQGERETVARSRAALLEPKLFKLTVAVAPGAPAGLKVLRNDTEVRREVWNADVPVDPGAYTLSASAPGKKPWSTKIQVPEGAGAQTVTVPPLEDAPQAAPPPTTPAPTAAPAPAPTSAPTPPPETPGSGQRIAGGVVTGLGGAALVVGSVLGLLAMSKNNDAKTACPNVPCSDKTGIDLSHDAGTFADASTAMFVVGGAAVAAGVIVIVTAPRKKAAAPAGSAWVAPAIGPGTLGLVAGRSF